MHFERIKTPGLAHVAYLIGNKGEAAVVDPRRDVDEYLKLARKHKLTIKYAIETHRQEDFVMGSAELARQCGAKVINGRHKAFGRGDIRLDDGEAFDIAGGIRIVALHTPGHTPESMCYAVQLDDAPDLAWAVFTGDTLFVGETGRTDLTDPLQTTEHAAQLYDAVHAKLLPLGDQTIVLPAQPPTEEGARGREPRAAERDGRHPGTRHQATARRRGPAPRPGCPCQRGFLTRGHRLPIVALLVEKRDHVEPPAPGTRGGDPRCNG